MPGLQFCKPSCKPGDLGFRKVNPDKVENLGSEARFGTSEHDRRSLLHNQKRFKIYFLLRSQQKVTTLQVFMKRLERVVLARG